MASRGAAAGPQPHQATTRTSETAAAAATPHVAALSGRSAVERASRGGTRPPLASAQRATKTGALTVGQQDVSGAVTKTVAPASAQDIARSMLGRYGWSADQFACLNDIYTRESGWNPSADNPYSGAYGIPQALPGDKMAAFGSDWQTNPATQLAWGLSYIRDRYGSPCGAWGFWQSHSWY
jgi:hypothetical protein